MHALRIGSFDKVRCPAVTAQQALQLIVADARQQRGIVDLVAIEMKDGQHRAIARWIQELVYVPRSGQWPSLGLAIADNYGDDQVGIVESRSASVRERVAEFA